MIKKRYAAILTVCVIGSIGFAQELSTPTPSPNEIPSPSPVSTESPSPTPTATATATVNSAARNVPLRFVPPPMEGTISLGIWDSNDKLVRVLHREAPIDTFEVEENSLSTTWDGRSETGEDLPAGKYRARGYLVGKMKVEDSTGGPSDSLHLTDHISVKLVTNPLVSDTRAVMELGVGFDSKGVFLKTMDGLPLVSLTTATNITRVAIEKDGEKAAQVWRDDGNVVKNLRVSNIDKMMAFDCGFFQLK